MAKRKRKIEFSPDRSASPGDAQPSGDLSQNYVAGSRNRGPASVLATEQADPNREHLTFETLREMMRDPDVSASVRLLKEHVMADGVQVSPAATDDRDALATDIAAFCRRQIEAIDCKAIGESLIEDSLVFGYKLAEQTFAYIERGPDAGRIGLESVCLLDQHDTSFVVDRFWRILGIQPRNDAPILLPVEKFLIFTPFRRNADPRGYAWIRPAFGGFNFKQQTWIHYDRFLDRHALPSVSMQPAPNAQARTLKSATGVPVIDAATGKPKTISPKADMLEAGVEWTNSRVLVTDNGAVVDLIEPESEGGIFEKTIPLASREIVKAILLQTRATNESEHGSRADSQTGNEILELFIWSLKNKIARAFQQQTLRTLVLLNWGEEALDLLPLVSLGDSERKDWAQDAGAVEMLFRKVSASQWDSLLTQLGIAPRADDEPHPYEAGQNNPNPSGTIPNGGQGL